MDAMASRLSGQFRSPRHLLPEPFVGHRIDIRFIFAYAVNAMDKGRKNGALLIAACIVASIRLRGEPIQRSPKVMAVISDSVQLAKMVLARLEQG
jgi:hypothetical protein